MMPIVTLSTGEEISTKSVQAARFVENGARLGTGFIDEPRDTAVEDELLRRALHVAMTFSTGAKRNGAAAT